VRFHPNEEREIQPQAGVLQYKKRMMKAQKGAKVNGGGQAQNSRPVPAMACQSRCDRLVVCAFTEVSVLLAQPLCACGTVEELTEEKVRRPYANQQGERAKRACKGKGRRFR